MSFSEWKSIRISEICDIRRGASPRPIMDYLVDKGIPWVKISDATSANSRYIEKTHEFIKEDGRKRSVYVTKGTLILSNSATPGLPKIMGIDACIHDGWLMFSNYRGVIKEYLYYLLLFEKERILLSANGSVFKNLKTDILKNHIVKIPNISEQRAIADILSSLDEKIELNNQMNETLEEMAQALFKRWFVDFEFPNEEGQPYKSSGGEMVESELGMIPRGWSVKGLGELINISSGKRPSKKSSEKDKEYRYPLIGASSIMGYVLEPLCEDKILVIGRVGTHGVVQRFCGPVWPSDNTLVIRTVYYEFINQILQRIDYSAINRGSTQPLITQTDIKNTKIIVPDKNLLKVYEEKCESLFNMIEHNEIEKVYLGSLRDTLLPKLMSGEIRVSDFES